VATPNNLTVDSYGIVDVSRGLVVLFVPHFRSPRWFIVQLGDAFDDVVFNVGGTKAAMPGAYLITGPHFTGRVPGEMTQVSMRTNIGFVAVRIAVAGSADLPDAVNEQRGFGLVPLHEYLVEGSRTRPSTTARSAFPNLVHPKTCRCSTESAQR